MKLSQKELEERTKWIEGEGKAEEELGEGGIKELHATTKVKMLQKSNQVHVVVAVVDVVGGRCGLGLVS